MRPVFELDITQDHCPMTFVKTSLQLDKMASGAILKIKVASGEPLENLPRTATEQGHQVLSVSKSDDGYFFIEIQKG